MVRPANAARPVPSTLVDLASVIAAIGPINATESFCRALASAGAEALGTAAKKRAPEHGTIPNEQQGGTEEKAEVEEDVIDKVVKLYDVY
jgi:hypothetical protein